MQYIRKKIIKGQGYYHFQFMLRVGKRVALFDKYLGKEIPKDIQEKIPVYFNDIGLIYNANLHANVKKYFLPKKTVDIEKSHFWYKSMHHELFEKELKQFRDLFAVLFLLNSNQSEGSRLTKDHLEGYVTGKKKPRTPLEIEAANSFKALNFSFSREMKWNMKSVKRVHELLFDGLDVNAGKFKLENNVVSNQETTLWENVRPELSALMKWFNENRRKMYAPQIALEFHYRFEKIHPFADGNGRVGRLLLNAFLLQSGYMPVIFFTGNHKSYCNAIGQARDGRKKKLAHYFVEQTKKTRKAIDKYREEGVLRGGSKKIGQWEIERGRVRKY
ncbi:Fic family protein [Candidatus Peregrinibacteria bacterium]|jgi:Fic family protein|nr:Fic family protein [Candidatus Peregrinibacteria bacterium]MBT4631776.1 Fic family protein [Candidatus Peregrinibacteria bacterium]MBT5516839.1 Fic family protein [Candidatus Peregrinibacteria bacterium]MBT5824499.1 Fic family protein [Candidatus Peregrinibacteria bacterium]